MKSSEQQDGTRQRQSPEQARASVLEVVSRDDLGFTYRGGAGTTYRVWSSEREYRLLTPAERKALSALLAEGVVVHESGWRPHRGRVVKSRGHVYRN